MANLAKLVVNLEAQTAKYQSELEKANRKLGRFERYQKQRLAKVSAAFKSLAVAAAGIGAGLVIRGLRNMVNEASNATDALAKQADVLGLTTEKLTAYQLAARLTGNTNTGLEKGFTKLQKAIFDANNGLSTYIRAFDALKLDSKELATLSPDEQFEKIAKAFSNLSTQTEKVAVAYDLFGGRNVKLINLMQTVGDNLNKIEQDTIDWGLALSRVDARKIEMANDAMERARTAFSGVATQIALAAAPIREDIGNAFAAAIADAKGFKAEIATTMEALITGSVFAANAVRGISLALKGAKIAALSVAAKIAESIPVARVGPTLVFGEKARALNNAVRDAALASIDEVGAEIDALLDSFSDIDAVLAAYRSNYEALASLPEIEPIVIDTRKYEAGLQRIADLYAQLKTYTKEERRTIELEARLKFNLAEMENLLATSGLQDLEDKSKKTFDAMASYADQAASNIQDAFADFFYDFDFNLKDLLRSWFDTLRRMYANQLAQQLLGSMNSTGGGIFGFLTGIFGRASGGPVTAGRTYLVGETGPEYFTPGASGRIDTMGGMGNSVFNFTTYIGDNAPTDTRQLIPLLDERDRKLKSEFIDEINRGKYD